ncbi:MAG: VWA domain-containing protein [Acidobacteriota bacterium]|nr:VWA domain-containing protein [Acidobacteriota bacterium]
MKTQNDVFRERGVRFVGLLAVALLAALPLTRTAAAQEEDAGVASKTGDIEDRQRFGERLEITEVLLDVLVTDKDGNPVAGLDVGDFVVEEEGTEVELTGADFYTTRYGAAGAGIEGEIPASRYFVFFFHDQRLIADGNNQLLRQQLDAARESREWIEKEMKPSDWIAVTGYDVKLKVFQDFTQDREALLSAISDAARGRDPEKGRWTREPAAADGPSLLRELPTGRELRRETRKIYDGLTLLAEAMGNIVGRKTLLLLSIGFGEFDGLSPFARADQRYYPDLEEALNDNNVAVYPIDLTPQFLDHGQSGFLNQIANDTGGYYYKNFVSFLTPLREIADENVGYYLLSYRSKHPEGKQGYQKIKVKTRSPQLVVRAPRGYRFGAG